MNKSDMVRVCLQNLFRHRGRTMLTVLGVVVGCCAVIIMISIGIGMKEAQEQMLSQMGDLTIINVMPAGKVKITDEMVQNIQKLPRVEVASPKLSTSSLSLRIFAGKNRRYLSESPEVTGLYPEAIEPLGYRRLEGDGLGKKAFSVLIGQDFAYNFSDSKRPEGNNMVYGWPDEDGAVQPAYFDPLKTPLTLEIDSDNGEKKLVQSIYVAGRLKEDYGKGYETSMGLVMDIRELGKLIDEQRRASGKAALKKKEYSTALVKVGSIQDVEAVERKIQAMGLRTSSMESIRKPMEREARQKQMMLGGLGAVSLLVAALGIANTMMMSITERTREIGVMKALGCHLHDIRASFLLEAGCIGLLGGGVGSVLSGIISLVMNWLASRGTDPSAMLESGFADGGGAVATSVIPPWLILFALAFSVLIGVVSGYYPANKAVQIPALEAIKHD